MNKDGQKYILLIIESLRENDPKTGSILNAEIAKLWKFKYSDVKTTVFSIQSKNELIDLLESIISIQVRTGFIPHLHFEIHGFENGLELSNGDRINWSELMKYFSKINLLTKNYLVIYLSVCYGSSILKCINPLDRAPFKALITPAEKIYEWQFSPGFTSFYEEYFTSFDLNESVKRMNEEIGERIFGLVLGEYCFNRITRFEPDSEFGNELLSSLKIKLIHEKPWLQNETEEYIINLAKECRKNNSEFLKSHREYFLMKDLTS